AAARRAWARGFVGRGFVHRGPARLSAVHAAGGGRRQAGAGGAARRRPRRSTPLEIEAVARTHVAPSAAAARGTDADARGGGAARGVQTGARGPVIFGGDASGPRARPPAARADHPIREPKNG